MRCVAMSGQTRSEIGAGNLHERFEPVGLSCEFALKNLGATPLPWSAGHHFYFKLPWSAELTRSDYVILIPATKRLKQDATGGLITGPQLKTEEPLDNPALIDTLHTGLRGPNVVFGEKGRPAISLFSSAPRPSRRPMRVSSRGHSPMIRRFIASNRGWGRPMRPSTKSGCIS